MSQRRCSEYGEDDIVIGYLGGLRGGFVVEVGASDGEQDSNSYRLIHEYGWRAILVEPIPTLVEQLRVLYADNKAVTIVQSLIGTRSEMVEFWPYGDDKVGAVSTASQRWREKVIGEHGDQYATEPIRMLAQPLPTILDAYHCPHRIDFLSLDCEGLDTNIARGLTLDRYDVGVVCLEHGWGYQDADDAMAEHGYVLLQRTLGNSLYVPI